MSPRLSTDQVKVFMAENDHKVAVDLSSDLSGLEADIQNIVRELINNIQMNREELRIAMDGQFHGQRPRNLVIRIAPETEFRPLVYVELSPQELQQAEAFLASIFFNSSDPFVSRNNKNENIRRLSLYFALHQNQPLGIKTIEEGTGIPTTMIKNYLSRLALKFEGTSYALDVFEDSWTCFFHKRPGRQEPTEVRRVDK